MDTVTMASVWVTLSMLTTETIGAGSVVKIADTVSTAGNPRSREASIW